MSLTPKIKEEVLSSGENIISNGDRFFPNLNLKPVSMKSSRRNRSNSALPLY